MLTLTDDRLLRCDAYVDGAWTGAGSEGRFAVTDPAGGETLAMVADLDAADARGAIEAAHRALPAWRAKTAKARAQLMRAWFDLIMAAQEDLA
ncbi:MAG: aldehyde dehydrogenase family protein, partial [Pseudomonadota bacterium]